MRKEPNMLNRNGIWYFRIAVPKRVLDVRKAQGISSSTQIWKTLDTGDLRTAKIRMAQAKADALRGFEDELAAYANRPKPSADQMRSAAALFGATVSASLLNESLQELPTGPQVTKAKADQEAIARALDDGPTKDVAGQVAKYFDLDWVMYGSETLADGRVNLRATLWADMEAMDSKSVDPFIEHIAQVNGFRIDQDSVEHIHLTRMLQMAWIKALDEAATAAGSLDTNLLTQDEVLDRWSRPIEEAVPATPPGSATQLLASVPRAATRKIRDDVRTLYQTYLAERFPKLGASARLERERTIQQFVEVVGLKEPTDYRKADMAAFKSALVKLPPNATRDYPGMSVGQIIASLDDAIPRLADKSVRIRLSYMSAFGKWLADNIDGVEAANFQTSAPSAKTKPAVVQEFTDDQVRHIFTSPTFTGCQSERNQTLPGTHKVRDYRFWLPLLAAYTGCRLNELTQLRVSDILKQGGIWVLKITAAGENQSLKTRSSERLVPVHSQLLKAGFIEHVDAVRNRGHDVLFPDIPTDRNGRRSEAASKRFRKFLVRLGVKGAGDRGGMHRFRHTVVEKLRQAGNSDLEIALVVGHESGSSRMTAGYGSSRQLLVSQRAVVLESLSYDGLDCAIFNPPKNAA